MKLLKKFRTLFNKKEFVKIKKPEKIESELDVYTYAASQIESVRSNYSYLAALLTIIVTFGAALIAYISYNNVSEVKNDANKEYDRITNLIVEKMDIITERKQLNLDKEIFLIEKGVKEKIAEEFERDNIRDLMEEIADTYTDEVIRSRISEEVNPLFASTKDELYVMSNKIMQTEKLSEQGLYETKSELNKILLRTRNQLDSLQVIIDFNMLVTSAQSGSRKDWDRLNQLAKNKNYIFQSRAYDSYEKILNEYSDPLRMRNVIDTFKVDDNRVHLDTLIALYTIKNEKDKSNYDVHSRLIMIKYIWESKNFKIKDKLDFLIMVLRNDNRLEAVSYVGKLFTEHTKLKIKYCAVDYLYEWWVKNKDKY
jgi:hypothetical protein